jgi:hypothetical protein
MKPEDLKKLASQGKKRNDAKASIQKLRKTLQDLDKDSKSLVEVVKNNPEI